MSPSRIFILRPVATSLLMIAIMLSGIVAFQFLPLSALPEVDYPTIQVQTFYPGASPDVMTSSVTAPLEVQLGQMPGLRQMSSVSSSGASVITLQFTLTLSLDIAEQEVQAAINAAGNLLPTDLPAPPIYAKVNPADAPIVTLALTSETLPLPKIEDLAETRLAQKISQLPGIGLVSISGGQRPAVRVQADLRKLAAYGLNIDDLRTTLGNANVNTPKGNFDGPARAYTINANDQLQSADAYKDLVIAYKNGSPVKLSDVATVVEGAQNNFLAAWMAIGVAMAASLYDPAFATLGRIFGAEARRPITILTFMGGFASTVSWPTTYVLIEHLGWKGAYLVYAALLAFVAAPLLAFALPRERFKARPLAPGEVHLPPKTLPARGAVFILVIVAFTAYAFIPSALSAHMLAIFNRLGIDPKVAVGLGALFGPAQVLSRLAEFLYAREIRPLVIARFAVALAVAGFALIFAFGISLWVATAFVVMFGVTNGLMTIARGTVPLTLFGAGGYGKIVGRIGGPALVMQAAAPLVLAFVAERLSDYHALGVVALFGVAALISFCLVRRP